MRLLLVKPLQGNSTMSHPTALSPEVTAALHAANEVSAFCQWCGIQITEAMLGRIELQARWRPEFGQFMGFMHAGVVAALIDTACGYAAGSVVGRVLTSHVSINCLRPAVGELFIARARVVKPGKQQIFTACEFYAVTNGEEKLVATGETLLMTVTA
jgi:uncharacterized protein (TIGR00369 family)